MTNAKFSIPRTPKLSCRLRPDKKEEKTAATIKLFFAFRKAGRKYSREPGLKFPGDHVARRGSERKEGEGGHGSGKIAVFEAGGGEGGRAAIRLFRPLSSLLLSDLGKTFSPQLSRGKSSLPYARKAAALGNQSERDAGKIAAKRVISGQQKISNEALRGEFLLVLRLGTPTHKKNPTSKRAKFC